MWLTVPGHAINVIKHQKFSYCWLFLLITIYCCLRGRQKFTKLWLKFTSCSNARWKINIDFCACFVQHTYNIVVYVSVRLSHPHFVSRVSLFVPREELAKLPWKGHNNQCDSMFLFSTDLLLSSTCALHLLTNILKRIQPLDTCI